MFESEFQASLCISVCLCCTYSTTRRPSLLKAWSGMWLMWLRARVMACRVASSLRASTGTSVRELSSNHRWRSERRLEKQPMGTLEMWLASRRLQRETQSYVFMKFSLSAANHKTTIVFVWTCKCLETVPDDRFCVDCCMDG